MSVSKPGNISLIYLGTRGGGARLLRDLTVKWSEDSCLDSIFVREDCEFFSDLKGDVYPLTLPANRLMLLVPSIRRRIAKEILFELQKKSSQNILFVMSHPWNPFLLKILKKSKINTISIIHDDRPHLGEFWPTRRHVLKEHEFSILIVFLSRYVAERFNHKKDRLVLDLQALPLLESQAKIKRVVIPGRIRKYKGLLEVLSYLEHIPHDYEILIAGQGKFKIPRSLSSRILLDNTWLSSFDFEKLIMESSHVLLPYVEATQSGIISIAKLYNCRVLINDVGGLREQLADYQNWALIPQNPKDLVNVLNAPECNSNFAFSSNSTIFDLPKIISDPLK
jgi:glycosyltransferase involved in cell wall biosynthesis